MSRSRDAALLDRLFVLVRACALPAPRVVGVDGFAAYVGCIRRMARSPVPRQGQRGRCRLQEWDGLVVGPVVKQRAGRCVVGVTRRVACGTAGWAAYLLRGGTTHTAYIERLNATVRARLAPLARRTRAAGRTVARLEAAGALWAGWLVGTVYNFCTPHASLARGQTPAMAAGLTGRVWTVGELLAHRVPPPPWQPPKRRGRRSQATLALMERWVT